MLLLDNTNLVWVIFDKGGVWPVLWVCAGLCSLLRGAQTLVCGGSSGGCGGGSEAHSGWICVAQDALTLQGAEVAIVCVIAIKGRRVINRSSKDGGGRVKGGGGGSRGGGGRRWGTQSSAGGGAIWLPRLPRLLMLLLLVRRSNFHQRPQFGFGCSVLRRPGRGPAVKTRSQFVAAATDEAPGQILALAVEVLEMPEVVVVVIVEMAENGGFHARQRRRRDGLGGKRRPVALLLAVIVAFVGHLVWAEFTHAADLLPVGLSRARVVRERVHVQTDAWKKKKKRNKYINKQEEEIWHKRAHKLLKRIVNLWHNLQNFYPFWHKFLEHLFFITQINSCFPFSTIIDSYHHGNAINRLLLLRPLVLRAARVSALPLTCHQSR